MILERFFKKINLPIVIILLIPLILTIIWFKSGNIMGTAESGLPFYNFNFQLNLNKDAWSGYTLGLPNNIGVASIPMYWFFANLQNIGISSFLLQMFFFWLILTSSGLSIFLLARQFFPKLENKFLLLTVFFYWFNPFSLINIWNRFLTNFLVSYVFIPIALYLFIKGINQGKYLFAILIGFLSIVCSHAETSVTFNILFWLIIFYTAVFNIFITREWSRKIFIIKFFLLTFSFWLLINNWWIGQVMAYFFVGSFSTVSTSSFTSFGNYQTFSILSKSLGNVVDLIRLKHDYFTSDNLLWTNILNTPLFLLTSFIMTSIVLVAIVFIKNRTTFFFGGLFLIGIFLAKGNNPPFGEINDKLFLSVPLMQIFRNPFEKFGYLIALASSFLFTSGLYFIYKFLNQKYRNFLYLFILAIIILIWGLPFWTGLVFVGFEEPTNNPKVGFEVKVPEYYKAASMWLESQKEDFRIIALPLSGEGITYKWEKGYSGLELTNQLLPKSAISLNNNIPFYNEVSKNIEKLFLINNDLSYLANALNVKYIMLRQDINWEYRKIKNPDILLSVFMEKEKKGELKKVAHFGELIFWEILSKTKNKIFTSNSALLDYSKPEIRDLDFSKNNLVINSKDKTGKKLANQIEGEIIHPQARFFLDHFGEDYFEIRQDLFPHVSILPMDKRYFLVLIKDRLKEGTIKDQEKLLEYRLIILGKRLVEVKLSADLNNEKGIALAIKEYSTLLIRTFKLIEEFENSDYGNKQASLQSKFYLLFSKHIKVLEDIKTNPNFSIQTKKEADNVLSELKVYLVKASIYPISGFLMSEGFPVKRRILYNFEVKDSGDYELIWDQKILNGFYTLSVNDQITLQVDDKISRRKIQNNGKGYISLGKINLKTGTHEIGINLPEALNLVDFTQQINFKVDHGSQVRLFSVNNYDPYSSYGIDFDYWIKKGNGVQISVYDKKPENIIFTTKPVQTFVIGPDLYDFSLKNYFTGFKLPEGVDQATISLTVSPSNNCETIFFSKGRQRCEDINFKKRYDRTTEVDLSNLSVTRDFNDLPMLLRIDSIKTNEPPQHQFTKLDGTTYQVKIKNARRPFFLIFSELFDPGWRVMDANEKLLNYQHYLANGYANSWYVDKIGSYEIILKFTPQYLLDYGEKISISAVCIGVIFILFQIYRRKNV